MKKIFFSFVLLLLITISVYVWTYAPIITGYAAQTICSGIFLSNRTAAEIERDELGSFPCFHLPKYQINYSDSSVTATFLGMAAKTAVYRKGLGTTLINKISVKALRNQRIILPLPLNTLQETIRWPQGNLVCDTIPKGVDTSQLAKAVSWAFYHKDYSISPTRAVVVIYNDQLVYEKYAKGFTANTRQTGWSMAKSIRNAMMGVMVHQGKLDMSSRAPLTECGKSTAIGPHSPVHIDLSSPFSMIPLHQIKLIPNKYWISSGYINLTNMNQNFLIGRSTTNGIRGAKLMDFPNKDQNITGDLQNITQTAFTNFYFQKAQSIDKLNLSIMIYNVDYLLQSRYGLNNGNWGKPRLLLKNTNKSFININLLKNSIREKPILSLSTVAPLSTCEVCTEFALIGTLYDLNTGDVVSSDVIDAWTECTIPDDSIYVLIPYGEPPVVVRSKADHKMPNQGNLPKNGTTDVQYGAMCAFKTLEWISKYFGGSTTAFESALWLAVALGQDFNILIATITANGIDFNQIKMIADHYFDINTPAGVMQSHTSSKG